MKRADDFNQMPIPAFGPQLSAFIRLRCPSKLLPAVRRAARRRTISSSAYIRQAIVELLKTDGVDINSQEIR
jgi:Ribbon-helix-helix protein, copG family